MHDTILVGGLDIPTRRLHSSYYILTTAVAVMLAFIVPVIFLRIGTRRYIPREVLRLVQNVSCLRPLSWFEASLIEGFEAPLIEGHVYVHQLIISDTIGC
ncbi:hypothetical protein R6Q59_029776 [Mikania micrantha]